jgi:AcrR family transcriptional regulator
LTLEFLGGRLDFLNNPMANAMVKVELDDAVRELIRDASLDLAASERVIPTLDAIAEKTGLSAAQIEAYYPSMDDVAIEIEKVARELFWGPKSAMPQSGSLLEMFEELAQLRAHYYEVAADFLHLGDAAARFLPSVATTNAINAARYRASLSEMLEPLCLSQTAIVVAKVEMISSWESWRHLRGVQRLSVEQAIEVIKSVLTAVASEVRQPVLAD